jgi:hypothetical protein
MYTHIYISRTIRPSDCLHTKNTYARRPVPHLGTKSAHQPMYDKKSIQYTSIRGPLSHPHLPLPQEEVVAHPHLPQVVVVEHLQDPPSPAVGVHWSWRQAQLLVARSTAMVEVTLCTAPGTPRPGYGSTCPQARPVTPSPDDGVYHQNHLRPSPEERVMALHQGHQIGASSPISRALLVPPQPHPTAYVTAVLGSLFIQSPRGTLFFISWSGTHAHGHICQIHAHIFDSL